MCLWEVILSVQGYRNGVIEQWRMTRQTVYTIAAVNRNPKKPFPAIEKFLPLPGDDELLKERGSSLKERYLATKKRYQELGII